MKEICNVCISMCVCVYICVWKNDVNRTYVGSLQRIKRLILNPFIAAFKGLFGASFRMRRKIKWMQSVV